jgi:hypothetical protein
LALEALHASFCLDVRQAHAALTAAIATIALQEAEVLRMEQDAHVGPALFRARIVTATS